MTGRTIAAIKPIAMPTIDPVDICAVLGGFLAFAGIDWLDAELNKLVVKLEGLAELEDSVIVVVTEALSSIVAEDDVVGVAAESPVAVIVCCTTCVMVALSSVVSAPRPSEPSGVCVSYTVTAILKYLRQLDNCTKYLRTRFWMRETKDGRRAWSVLFVAA